MTRLTQFKKNLTSHELLIFKGGKALSMGSFTDSDQREEGGSEGHAQTTEGKEGEKAVYTL